MEKIRVYNRSNSIVFYQDEDNNKHRSWEPTSNGKESYKDLDFEEIERMVNTRGGRVLFEQYLLIKEPEICSRLDLDCPDEYFYDTNKVIQILENGSENDLINMLDNAPDGVKDLIKQAAIEIKLDSSRKRQIIKDKLNFDINFAIDSEVEFDSKISMTDIDENSKPKYKIER